MSEQIKEENITIRRAAHDKTNPYVMISKVMLHDHNLSLSSKGAFCYLLSLPNDWITYPRKLAEVLKISKNQVYSILNELISLGYATKHLERNTKGRFGKVIYEFHEEKIQIISTVSQNPDTDNPDTEKGTLLKNNKTKEKQDKEKKITKKSGGGVLFDRTCKEFKNIDQEYMAELRRAFPGVDIDAQLRLMRLWLIDPDNPMRLGNKAFITKWLVKQTSNLAKVSAVLEPEPELPKHLNTPYSQGNPNEPRRNHESST